MTILGSHVFQSMDGAKYSRRPATAPALDIKKVKLCRMNLC